MPDLVTVARINVNQARSDLAPLAAELDDLEKNRTLKVDARQAERELQRFGREIAGVVGDQEIKITVDDSEIDQIKNIAADLDGLVADIEVDADPAKIQDAFDLAERLDTLSAFVDIDADDSELQEALDITDQLNRLTAVVQVEAQTAALKDALDFAEELDKPRTIDVSVDDSEAKEIVRLVESLDGLIADVEIDADDSKLKQARDLAEAIDRITATIDIDAETDEIREALDLGERLDRLNAVIDVDVRSDEIRQARSLIEDLDDEQVDIEFEADFSEVRDALSRLDISAAGQALGTQLTTGLRSQLSSFATAAGPAGLAGLAIGGALIGGIADGLSRQRAQLDLAIRTGFDSNQLRSVGQASADAYVAGFGESRAELKEIAATIEGELSAIDPRIDLTDITKQFSVLTDVIGFELGSAVENTQRLITQGLVGDTQDALNLQVAAAQEFGNSFEEVFEVVNEFGGVFSKLGIEGSEAAYFIGDAWRDGLLPNIDRGAELFEEFNIRLSDATAQEAVEALGLEFKGLQDALADGRGAESLNQIVGALLDVESKAARTELALQIFGTPIESASDLDAVLRGLQGTVDGTTDEFSNLDSAAQDAADSIERSFSAQVGGDVREFQVGLQSVNDWLGRVVVSVNEWEQEQSWIEDIGIASYINELRETDEETRKLGVTSAELSAITDQGTDSYNDFKEALARSRIPETTDDLEDFGDAAEDSSRSVEELEESIAGLVGEINQLFDFSADDLFRDLAENAAQLTEELAGVGPEVLNVAGAIDISTESGRNFQETLQDQSGLLQDLVDAYAEGAITSGQFAQESGLLEDQLVDQLLAIGLTTEEIDGLIGKYLEIPADIETQLRTDVDLVALDSFIEKIALLPEEKRLALGIDLDDTAAVDVAFRATAALESLEPKIRVGVDIDQDAIVSAQEAAQVLDRIEANAKLGFDVDQSGQIDALEAAQTFQEFDFLAQIGFDTDFSGLVDAGERAQAFNTIEALAKVGFQVDDDPLLTAQERALAYQANEFLASIGYQLQDGEIIEAQNRGQEFASQDFEADASVNPADARAVFNDINQAGKSFAAQDFEASADVDSSDALRKINDAENEGRDYGNKNFRSELTTDDRASSVIRDVERVGNNYANKTFTADIVARDFATKTIQGIQGKTVYVTVRNRTGGGTRIFQADGGIVGADGREYMRNGGILDGIQPAVPGGVAGRVNGRDFVMAENGGAELFLNQYSRPERKLALLRNFDNGNLDRLLRRSYGNDSDDRFNRLATSVQTLAAAVQAGGGEQINVQVAGTPILDPAMAAREIGRQTGRAVNARRRSYTPAVVY